MQILREECPWDRQQTPGSIAPCTLEEAHEVLEAVELAESDGNWEPLKEELGDLLLHIAFYARMAEEQGAFDLQAVFDALVAKMMARHPHVFGEHKLHQADAVLQQWDAIKAKEKPERSSVMDGIPPLPALAYARKVHQRARSIGFDWQQTDEVIEKIREELNEFIHELDIQASKERLNDEFGDLLFALVNLADQLELDAETCLMHTNRKFASRIRRMETLAEQNGTALAELPLKAQQALYQQIKNQHE